MTIDQSKKNKMVELYLEGYSAPQITKKFDCSYIVCYNELRRRGIKIRNNSEANKLLSGITEENREIMADLYNDGWNSTELSKKFGLSKGAILVEINKKTIPRTPDKYNRKYTIDDNYFNTINDENKAYWLGFIATDGSVSKINNNISIGLKKDDFKHLYKLKTALKSERKVGKYNHMAQFSFSSKSIKEKLISYGIVPNKSLTLKPPSKKQLNKFEKDFWRGCIDGDGGIGVYKNKPQIYFCGTYDMVNGFIKFVEKNINNTKGRRPLLLKNKLFQINYSAASVVPSIIKLLYKDCETYLNRKMKKARRYI